MHIYLYVKYTHIWNELWGIQDTTCWKMDTGGWQLPALLSCLSIYHVHSTKRDRPTRWVYVILMKAKIGNQTFLIWFTKRIQVFYKHFPTLFSVLISGPRVSPYRQALIHELCVTLFPIFSHLIFLICFVSVGICILQRYGCYALLSISQSRI